jgi:hypothetical protein
VRFIRWPRQQILAVRLKLRNQSVDLGDVHVDILDGPRALAAERGLRLSPLVAVAFEAQASLSEVGLNAGEGSSPARGRGGSINRHIEF